MSVERRCDVCGHAVETIGLLDGTAQVICAGTGAVDRPARRLDLCADCWSGVFRYMKEMGLD